MSPYSASSVMAMAAMGARGTTLQQIREGMVFPGEEEMKEGFGDLFDMMKGNDDFTLEMANNLFVQDGYQLMEEFKKVLKQSFDAEVKQTNFAESEAARKLINAWVEDKTRQKIKDLIPDGVLDGLTRLVLVNAIYFKGDWASKFDKSDTKDDDFFVNKDKKVTTKMMFQENDFKTA